MHSQNWGPVLTIILINLDSSYRSRQRDIRCHGIPSSRTLTRNRRSRKDHFVSERSVKATQNDGLGRRRDLWYNIFVPRLGRKLGTPILESFLPSWPLSYNISLCSFIRPSHWLLALQLLLHCIFFNHLLLAIRNFRLSFYFLSRDFNSRSSGLLYCYRKFLLSYVKYIFGHIHRQMAGESPLDYAEYRSAFVYNCIWFDDLRSRLHRWLKKILHQCFTRIEITRWDCI